MSRPSRMRYSCLLQSHVVSLLLSLVSTLFSDWRLTFFDIQVPSVSNKELVLPLHAHCGLSRLLCNGHSLLSNSYLSRTGIIEDPSCSVCGHPSQDTSHPILHCLFAPHALWQLFAYLQPLVQVLGRFLACGAPWSPTMPHTSEGMG